MLSDDVVFFQANQINQSDTEDDTEDNNEDAPLFTPTEGLFVINI